MQASLTFFTRFALSLNKIGCTSAESSSKLDFLHSVCTIFVGDRLNTYLFLAKLRIFFHNSRFYDVESRLVHTPLRCVHMAFPCAHTRLPIFVFLSAFCTFARNSLIFNGKSSVDTCTLCLHCCLHCNRKTLQAGVRGNEV